MAQWLCATGVGAASLTVGGGQFAARPPAESEPELLSMNGTIAQLVALAGHVNSALDGCASGPAFWPDHSTCVFWDRDRFKAPVQGIIGAGEKLFAHPEDGVSWLIESSCTGAGIWNGIASSPTAIRKIDQFVPGANNLWMPWSGCHG